MSEHKRLMKVDRRKSIELEKLQEKCMLVKEHLYGLQALQDSKLDGIRQEY